MSASRRTAALPEAKTPAAYAAEIVGTFILVFSICGAVSVSSSGEGLTLDLAGLALVHALALMIGVYALGGTSGAHFNPAVTAALLAVGKIRSRDAGIYVVCQLIGGVLAGLAVFLLFHDAGAAVDYAAPAIDDAVVTDGSPVLGLLVEAIGTAILMWAIMGVAVNPRGDAPFAGLVIGGALGAAVFVAGPATSGSLNPARWLGPALVSGEFGDFWVYILGPILGATAAAVAYRALILEPRGLGAERPVDTLDEEPLRRP